MKVVALAHVSSKIKFSGLFIQIYIAISNNKATEREFSNSSKNFRCL